MIKFLVDTFIVLGITVLVFILIPIIATLIVFWVDWTITIFEVTTTFYRNVFRIIKEKVFKR
jgi:hypothetical protein